MLLLIEGPNPYSYLMPSFFMKDMIYDNENCIFSNYTSKERTRQGVRIAYSESLLILSFINCNF